MSTSYGTCALQFPSSYVLMDTEEMEYLDGGGIGQSIAYYAVKYGLDVAVNAALGGGTIALIRSLSGVAKNKLKQQLVSAIGKWVSARVANLIVGNCFGIILDVATGSVGTVIANWLDKKDGCIDKQIYFSRVF